MGGEWHPYFGYHKHEMTPLVVGTWGWGCHKDGGARGVGVVPGVGAMGVRGHKTINVNQKH